MNRAFEILCNYCGSKLLLQPFEQQVVCRNCQTYLKIEETETTLSTIVIDANEFLGLENKPTIYGNKKQDTIQDLKERLKQLEENWVLEQENFKIKSGQKRILPRRKQSLLMLIIGSGMVLISIYSFLFSDKYDFVLLLVGTSFIVSNSREFQKFRKYKEAEQDFLDEKERLEYEILLLE